MKIFVTPSTFQLHEINLLTVMQGPWWCSSQIAHLQPLRLPVRISAWTLYVDNLVFTC